MPAIGYGFVWDDIPLIAHNPLLRGRGTLGRLLLSDFWAASGLHTGFWRPLVSFSYWLDARLFHWAPAGFHAMNIAAHSAASAAVALIVGQSGLGSAAALVAGLWFTLLPAHVEPVASVSGRTDVYSAALTLLAFWLDRRARQAGRRFPGWGAVAASALALLAKEASVALLPLLALAEWVECSRARAAPGARAGSLRWLSPYLLIWVAYLALHVVIVPLGGANAGVDPAMIPRARWCTGLEFPAHLAFLWPWTGHAPGPVLHLPERPWSPDVLASLAFQIGFVAWLAFMVARRSALAVPIALVWLPFLPISAAGLGYGRVLFAERFVYLPSAGAAWLLGAVVAAAWRTRSRADAGPIALLPAWVGTGLTAALVAAGAIRSATALPMWRDERSVFGSMAAQRPENPIGHAWWARLLATEGQLERARAEVRRARELDPKLPLTDLVEAWIELIGGRAAEAVPFLSRALSDPQIALSGETHYELGLAEAELQHLREARVEFERAVSLDPTHYDAWLRLALTSHLFGDSATRDAALARAAVLPEASDGRVEKLRRQIAALPVRAPAARPKPR